MKHLKRFINYCSIVCRKRLARLSFPLAMLLLLPSLANAGLLVDIFRTIAGVIPFHTWHVVELPLSSGASCGNGSPYRFFVNRSALSENMVVSYEGGGACTDQKTCDAQKVASIAVKESPYEKLAKQLTATNPNGISANHIWTNGIAVAGKVTPFTDRAGVSEKLATQSWDMVYLPYCTGDVHLGSSIRTFTDNDPLNPRVQYFAGQSNIREAAKWIRQNLGKPKNLLVTGFSAGGFGATGSYPIMRDTLQPTGKSALVADSGVVLSTPQNGSSDQYPVRLMTDLSFKMWGLNDAGGLFPKVYAGMNGFVPTNPSTVYAALSKTYPQDRFGITTFSKDRLIPLFNYLRSFPEHKSMSEAEIIASTEAKFFQDLNTWRRDIIQPLSTNIGYYKPMYRDVLQSHCSTIVTFRGTAIEELGIGSVKQFIENVLDHKSGDAVMRRVEIDRESDMLWWRSVGVRFVFDMLDWLT